MAKQSFPWRIVTGCLLSRKVEQFALAGPFRRQFGEASNSHAVWEPTLNGRSDKVNASEIVILTLRTLQPSRLAMLSVGRRLCKVGVRTAYGVGKGCCRAQRSA
jgi:hypothetical protein